MAKRPLVPRDNRISDSSGTLSTTWLRFFDDLARPIDNVKITGNATVDIAALINALIAAGIMKKDA